MSTTPRKTNPMADALIAAWQQLYPDPETGKPGDTAARAALRRAATPEAVLMEPAFHALLRRMKGFGVNAGTGTTTHGRYIQLALIAGVLAERRGPQDGPMSFMHSLGGSPDACERALPGLRFQALMTALDGDSGENKMRALRRAMKMVRDKDFNLKAFASDLLNWSPGTRIAWTFDYFGRHHQSVTPGTEPQSTDVEELSQ